MTRRSSVPKLRTESSWNMPFLVASAIFSPYVYGPVQCGPQATLFGQSYTKLTRRFCGAAASGHQSFDLVDQVARRERLGHVEVGSHSHSLAHFHVAPLGRKHNDLHVRPFRPLADTLAHFVAALDRHHDVEQ